MPFSCVFQLNYGAIGSQDEVIFEHFVEESFGRFSSKLVAIAKIQFNGQEAYIATSCPCLPFAKGQLAKGDRITSETKIGCFAADGEDIPYNRPSATILLKEASA